MNTTTRVCRRTATSPARRTETSAISDPIRRRARSASRVRSRCGVCHQLSLTHRRPQRPSRRRRPAGLPAGAVLLPGGEVQLPLPFLFDDPTATANVSTPRRDDPAGTMSAIARTQPVWLDAFDPTGMLLPEPATVPTEGDASKRIGPTR